MRARAKGSFTYPISPLEHLVCGADEAGRGPLMGNVVAGCVILKPDDRIEGLDDSKRLTARKREALELEIKARALAWGVGQCTPEEIDSINILNASLLAMRRAYEAMGRACELMLVDGNKVPKGMQVMVQAVVGGDALVPEISAASILAKVERDRQMMELDRLHPEYGFAKHKGYPTAAHLQALSRLPVLPCYRRSYGPVKKILAERGALEA